VTASGTATFASAAAGPQTVNITGIALSGAAAGNYVIVSTTGTAIATITQARPTVSVSDAGGTFNGSAFPATATMAGVVAGVDNMPAGTLEGVAPTVSYYGGRSATGTPIAGAPSSVGTYTVVASFAGSADYAPATSSPQTFTISPAVAPALVSTRVGDGSAQRSAVSSITVVFNEAVNFSAASFTLDETQNENVGFTWTNVTSGVAFSNPSGDGMTWVISVIAGGSLDRTGSAGKGLFSDGIYQLTLNGADITDAATGTAQFNNGSVQVATFNNVAGVSKNAFSVLYGDMLGTGIVNNSDYLQFRKTYGSNNKGLGAYNVYLDWNGDGQINNTDYLKFKANYGRSYSFS
jgi:hypothetical protein